jgi:hypothetical protein
LEFGVKRGNQGALESIVISKSRLLIAVTQEFNVAGVLFLDFKVTSQFIGILFLMRVNALNANQIHEEVCRVVPLRAPVLVPKRGEIVNCKFGFVEVHDLAFGEHHQSVEAIEYVRVRLMDCRYNGATTFREIIEGVHHSGRSK